MTSKIRAKKTKHDLNSHSKAPTLALVSFFSRHEWYNPVNLRVRPCGGIDVDLFKLRTNKPSGFRRFRRVHKHHHVAVQYWGSLSIRQVFFHCFSPLLIFCQYNIVLTYAVVYNVIVFEICVNIVDHLRAMRNVISSLNGIWADWICAYREFKQGRGE